MFIYILNFLFSKEFKMEHIVPSIYLQIYFLHFPVLQPDNVASNLTITKPKIVYKQNK